MFKYFFIQYIWFIKADFHLCLINKFLQFSKYFTFMFKNEIFRLNLLIARLCYYFKGSHPN